MAKRLTMAEKIARRLERRFGSSIQYTGFKDLLKVIEEALKKENFTVNYHRPVCAACQVEMHPERNGVGLLDMADFGPYNLWDADLWQCSKCGLQIVCGFGNNPIGSNYEGERFEKLVKSYRDNSIVIESR